MCIRDSLEGVTAEVAKVRAHMPEILQWQRERLVSRLEDAEAVSYTHLDVYKRQMFPTSCRPTYTRRC